MQMNEKDYEDPTRNELFYDRQRAIGIMVAASPDADIIKVGHRVEKKLEQLKAERLPAGVECHKVFYQPERVGTSLGTFILNLIESVIIVVVILMIAMGFKSGVIIGISLVVTVFGSSPSTAFSIIVSLSFSVSSTLALPSLSTLASGFTSTVGTSGFSGCGCRISASEATADTDRVRM